MTETGPLHFVQGDKRFLAPVPAPLPYETLRVFRFMKSIRMDWSWRSKATSHKFNYTIILPTSCRKSAGQPIVIAL
jgi:hypothetical protein